MRLANTSLFRRLTLTVLKSSRAESAHSFLNPNVHALMRSQICAIVHSRIYGSDNCDTATMLPGAFLHSRVH